MIEAKEEELLFRRNQKKADFNEMKIKRMENA